MKCTDSSQLYYNYVCVSVCPDGYGETSPGRCGLCTDSNLFYYDHGCVTLCPEDYGPSGSGWCIKCTDSSLLYHSHTCVSSCPEGYVETTPGRCGLCSTINLLYYNNACISSCPEGYVENTSRWCVACDASLLYYNRTCVSSCPDGYVETSSRRCGRCSDSNLLYYNRTCVNSCPAKTISLYNAITIQYECKPCYLGCDTCINTTSSGCLSCSEGFFFFDNSCNIGCPSDRYANPLTRVCEQCQPPCVTCSQPNNHSCTSCPPGYFVFDGTCVTSCPMDHYQTFFSGEDGLYQVPICLPKLVLTFNLSLTIDARAIDINFNYGVVSMILAIAQRIQIQIANTQIDEALFVLSPLAESKIRFKYLGDQYIPPLSLLQVTIDLDTTDFNSNSYQQFRIIDKTATIQLKEIYPFSKVETRFISSTSDITEAGGSAVAAIQAVNSIAQGALSTSLVRLQIIGEVVQLLRFIAIRWPPNVAEYFANSELDPSSIMIPVDSFGWLNDPLDDRNYSMPRVFDEYETSPFFSQNYNIDMSNLIIWVAVISGSSLLLYLLKKVLKKVTDRVDLPNDNNRKNKRHNGFILLIQKLSRFLNKLNGLTLWNFLLAFILSMFQSGCLWSLLNMRYDSALLESSTSSSRASLAIGIIFFLFFLTLLVLIFWILIINMKYLIQSEGTPEDPDQEERLQKYEILFEDFKRDKRIQILFLPISLLKSLWFVAVIALMSFSPITQMILCWILSTAFIAYFIIYQPLKVRWMRRMTLFIELSSYGCVKLGFILGVVDRFVDLDPTTADEIGFVFLILTIGATLGGAILSLIQVLQLVWSILQYLKELLAKKKQVHPIPPSELLSRTVIERSPSKEAENFLEDRSMRTSQIYLKNRSLSIPKSRGNLPEEQKMFATLRKLSPADFKNIPRGEQLYDDLKEWWNSFCSEVGNEAVNLEPFSPETQALRSARLANTLEEVGSSPCLTNSPKKNLKN